MKENGPDYIVQYQMNGKDQWQYAVDDEDLDRILNRIRFLGATDIDVFKHVPTPP